MIITVVDSNVVGETLATIFSMVQKSTPSFQLIITNNGINTINYRLQEHDGNNWIDLGASGSDYYNTLVANEVRTFKVTSTYSRLQLVANASGGAYMEFAAMWSVIRGSGQQIPVFS